MTSWPLLGRKFVGCEINPAHFEAAKKRIEAAGLQPGLFTPAVTAVVEE